MVQIKRVALLENIKFSNKSITQKKGTGQNRDAVKRIKLRVFEKVPKVLTKTP